jgi:hypothetical protein
MEYIWHKAADTTPKDGCEVRLFNIRTQKYSIARYKDGYFETSYISNTPVCISPKQYENIFWCELPMFIYFF